ncbi:unnamed protein product [Didymodactylos carnosus]|uniref:Uncharacterized protein n=1 Tax=Didymodactylos carnosus TaxID=1234261 RepID=A0A815PQ84_9BILA|nr:unnamed protein product [Didymodactylos carnosus]CAF1452360.1 unnamed protein product [Didymodactylos carnosus]CAF3597390.1 unnamed protein product [Didymodactylos carnosus]CAF4325251.1 unnamed protein product [Didymodactylos carnosus]
MGRAGGSGDYLSNRWEDFAKYDQLRSYRAPPVEENKLTPPVLVDPLQSVASLPAVQSASAASSLPSLPTDLLHKLPRQLQNVNSLWTLFTSFVSNIADNSSSLQAVVPSNVTDSLVPSSSAVQPSRFICYPAKHHTHYTLHTTFSLSNEEFESVYDVPASKRFCAHPQQTTTTAPSNQRKPPLQLASASKLATKKKISVKGPVHFSTNNVLEDDDDERTSSQVSIITPNQRKRPLSTYDVSERGDDSTEEDSILIKKRVPLVTRTTYTITNIGKLVARLDKCADRFLDENI